MLRKKVLRIDGPRGPLCGPGSEGSQGSKGSEGKVGGASPRGLWPPDGGRLCSLRSGGDSPNGLRVVVAAAPQFLKSALRINLSASYGKISILLTGSLRSPLPIRAAPDFSTGKRVTRFSGRFAPLRIVFPCHPYAGGRIKHREASLRQLNA